MNYIHFPIPSSDKEGIFLREDFSLFKFAI